MNVARTGYEIKTRSKTKNVNWGRWDIEKEAQHAGHAHTKRDARNAERRPKNEAGGNHEGYEVW